METRSNYEFSESLDDKFKSRKIKLNLGKRLKDIQTSVKDLVQISICDNLIILHYMASWIKKQ